MLGALIQGGMGLYGMMQGSKQMGNIASNMPNQQDLEKPYEESQGLIDRMTNFGQYSGQAMDLASQQGNKGVEDAMMMGMGGSQANAIKNRMKRSSLTGVYDKFNQGMGTALNAQMGINKGVSGQMHEDRGDARAIQMGQAGAQMGASSNFMGGADGMAGFGAGLGSLGQTALMGGYDKKKGVGMGGMLGMLGWGK
mgnify:CR=1 FL=1|tara:strand:+ start:39 stop:626 length:588 start_codon:yes stop_codon:yes gene_type:complete